METARVEADRAKRDSDARMAAAQNEADRLKNENDARMRLPERSGPAEK